MSSRPAPISPPRRPRRRLRTIFLWIGFGIAAVATALAVHRLYQTVQRELTEQADLALRQRRDEARERIREATEALKLSTMKTLAAFHVEGLAHALRQWDEGSAAIAGTFQWEEAGGFVSGPTTPATDVAALWREFRAWRETHPAATTSDPLVVGDYRTHVLRTVENPLFAAGDLGYQGENLEMLVYAGKKTDPWAGWAGHRRDGTTPWIFWYQPGPGAPVRGCRVDIGPLVVQLRSELGDGRLVRLELVASGKSDAVVASEVDQRELLDDWLPGFALVAAQGDLFVEKQGNARFAALAIVLLLGVFLIGAAFLAIFSRREALDAERKATFVTQVSHELRTPLTSIRMFADMLAAPDLPAEKRLKFSGTISRESERLGTLIERLLTFNALEKGGAPATLAPVDAGAIVRETLEEMDGTLQAAAMRVETALPAEPVVVATDRAALKQALLNLLENALKYARTGKLIRVELTSAADAVRLRVADAGPGIPRALGERVFEPFVQGGQTLVDKSPGLGLGLSIARGLLRRAGGDLLLLPSATGALFEIRLPRTLPS